jgi:hypothetical protein
MAGATAGDRWRRLKRAFAGLLHAIAENIEGRVELDVVKQHLKDVINDLRRSADCQREELMAAPDPFEHLRGPGLGHVFTDRNDLYDDMRRLLWMAVIAAGGELRLTPRGYPGDYLWGQKTYVSLDPASGEIVLTVGHVTP